MTKKAQAQGASEAEIREAVAAADQVRHWSTVLNGMQYDLDASKSEFDEMAGETELSHLIGAGAVGRRLPQDANSTFGVEEPYLRS